MKLFIVKFQEKFHIAVSAGSERIYFLDEMGFHFDSIEEFIKNTSTTEQENLKQLLNSNQIFKYPAHDKHEIIFHSPVIRPMQDIICLGMNYFKTLNETETTDFEDTVYFSKRVNYAVGDGETILAHSDIAKQLDYEAELQQFHFRLTIATFRKPVLNIFSSYRRKSLDKKEIKHIRGASFPLA